MLHSQILDSLMSMLPTISDRHAPGGGLHALLRQVARREIECLFKAEMPDARFGPFGDLTFPYVMMGAVDSLSLFDLDELIVFAFYWCNRRRYRRVADIGANIGLHSIVLNRCGYEVRSYEPDPAHFRLLKRNLALNGCLRVTPVNAAVSREVGSMEFIRVLGDTTGSHLAGSKPSPLGEIERFPVDVEAIEPLLGWADLLKLDVAGHEAEILLTTNERHWRKTDAIVEIGSEANARAVFEHFRSSAVRLFAQNHGWQPVDEVAMMPTSHRDGLLFITRKAEMPWREPTILAERKAS